MTITKTLDGTALTVAVDGRLDTLSSPQLEQSLSKSLDGVTELIFDLKKLVYISSAGLRVLLGAQKIMDDQKGTLTVKNAGPRIMEIFDVTGFLDMMNIQ